MNKNKKFLTVNQVAEYLEVSKQAVNSWINAGKLKVYRLPSGRIKILREDFLEYLKKHNLYIDRDIFKERKPRVLIIDDEIKIHTYLKNYIQLTGLDCETEYVKNGITGLIKIGSFKPDIIVLDLEMPEMDGLEVCRNILDGPFSLNSKIIIITGFYDKFKDELIDLDVEAVLKKPFDYKDLDENLRSLIEHR